MTDNEQPPTHLSAVPDLDSADEPQGLTEEQIIAYIGDIARALAQELPETMGRFAPHANPEKSAEIAVAIAREQFTLNSEVLPRMAVGGEQRIRVEFGLMDGSGEKGMLMDAPCQMSDAENMHDAVKTALFFALIDSPAARAILRLHGYAYHFSFGAPQAPLVTLT